MEAEVHMPKLLSKRHGVKETTTNFMKKKSRLANKENRRLHWMYVVYFTMFERGLVFVLLDLLFALANGIGLIFYVCYDLRLLLMAIWAFTRIQFDLCKLMHNWNFIGLLGFYFSVFSLPIS